MALGRMLFVTVLLGITEALQISKNARCGPEFGLTCAGSSFGRCCSKEGYCGSSDGCCAADTCQKGYGSCNDHSTMSTVIVPSSQAPANPSKITVTITEPYASCPAGDKTTITIPTTIGITTCPNSVTTVTTTRSGVGELTTVTVPTTITLPGAGQLTTVTIPTTVTLPDEDEIVTVTQPTTITIPGAGQLTTITLPTTVTLPGEGEFTTVTIPTTVTLPGEGEFTTVTIPTTVTLPGEGEIVTVTIPTTVTLPADLTTVTIPSTVTLPAELSTVTIPTTVTLPAEETTVTIPTTVTLPGEETITTTTATTTVTTCAPPSPPTTQAVVNSGFENSDAWLLSSGGSTQLTYVTGSQNSGSRALQASASNAANIAISFSQTVTLFPGAVYRLGLYGKANVASNCQVRATLGSTSLTFPSSILATSYTLKEVLYQPVQGVTSAVLTITGSCAQANVSPRTMHFDDVTLTIEGYYTPRQ